MYKRILVPLEHTSYDEAILEHVRALASFCKSAVILIHVADGWAARNIHQLALRESEEIHGDRAYLEGIAAGLERDGFEADAILASGDPVREIAAAARSGAVRPHRDVDARAPLLLGSPVWECGRVAAAPVHDSDTARARIEDGEDGGARRGELTPHAESC